MIDITTLGGDISVALVNSRDPHCARARRTGQIPPGSFSSHPSAVAASTVESDDEDWVQDDMREDVQDDAIIKPYPPRPTVTDEEEDDWETL